MAQTEYVDKDDSFTTSEMVDELKQLNKIFPPLTTMHLINYVRSIVSVLCMSKLGTLELAGGALAIGFTNITGYSLLSGLALGMESICGQAFGSQNHTLAYLTLRRTILLLLFTSIPISLLWLNLHPILLFLKQDGSLARVAGLYSISSLPDLITNSFAHPIRIYLRSRGTTAPLMWSSSIAVVFHIPLTLLLAFVFNLGVSGVAIASCCTNLNALICLLVYMLYSGAADAPTQSDQIMIISKGDHHHPSGNWATLLSLAVPSCIGVCLEWWWYEFMILSAGYLPDPRVAVAVASIVIQTTSLLYTFPVALGAAVSTRVSAELGARRPAKARLAAATGMMVAVCISLMSLAWTIAVKTSWGRAYSRDEKILSLAEKVLPVIGLCEIGNCPQTAGCGVLRGSARPKIGAKINLFSFYFVGAPVALILAFKFRFGFLGLCYGLLAAQIVAAIMVSGVIGNTRWEREIQKEAMLLGEGVSEHVDDPTLKANACNQA